MTEPRTLKARNPDDLLAVVPVVLGFHPENSMVMLTFGASPSSFHARIDLPPAHEIPAAGSLLLAAAETNRVARAAFILYTTDADLAAFAADWLTLEFEESGIPVVAVLRADGRQWFAADGSTGEGQPYDATTHPFAVQSIYDGAVTHSSRSALADSLDSLPAAVAGVAESLPDALRRLSQRQTPDEVVWVVSTVAEATRDGRSLRDEEVARLVVALAGTGLREMGWLALRRATASGHITLWTDVLRRTPDEFVAVPACLLALAAWLAGHGALAWCALDRCREVEPGFGLAEHVADALENAIPPTTWDDILDDQPSCESGSGDGGGVVP